MTMVLDVDTLNLKFRSDFREFESIVIGKPFQGGGVCDLPHFNSN